MAACQPEVDSSNLASQEHPLVPWASVLGSPPAGGCASEHKQRGPSGVFFRRPCTHTPAPSRACYYYQKYQTFQLKVRLNVSTAEIPHGSRWRGEPPAQPPDSPSLPFSLLLKNRTKVSTLSMLLGHSVSANLSVYIQENQGLGRRMAWASFD